MSRYAPDTPPDYLVEDPLCDRCGGDPAACDCYADDAAHPMAREESWDAPQDPGHRRSAKWGFHRS